MRASRHVDDGILLVDKPAGPTSHDMVALARRVLGTRKVGHTGTLDPFASGLLLLCVNRATRLAEYLHDHPKSYEARLRLGQVTTTLDTEGEVVEERPWESVNPSQVQEAVAALAGMVEQVPPAFSAKKVKGERAYERARRGEVVELDPVPVEIHEAQLLECSLPFVRISVRVSTGTYIRALARDLGERLGPGAHLTELRRTAIGPFRVEAAVPAHVLEAGEGLGVAWVSPLEALAHMTSLDVGPQEAGRLTSGQPIEAPANVVGRVAISQGGLLLAVAEEERGLLHPRKVFPHA